VRVVDNETGEDITSVALSQILSTTSARSGAVPRTLLSDLIQRSARASTDGSSAAGPTRR